MLSGETAVGQYPVETVQMMNQIIKFTEEFLKYKKTIKEPKKEFIEEDIPKPKQEKVFKNMSDFNLEVHRIKLLELEEPKKEFIMGIEVSDPMGKDGKRIVMRKYKETSHLGTVSEIKSNFQITEIPYDPSQHLNHMKNYAL
ncbi:hypothetical protein LCGC14_2617960 [marine sediment metagenome]|uniref:Uncharacterized protein n=1 Tax=marine sediment metagenome TaxID=412755 RepID=A0A0F9A465_9ZZZZ